MKLKGVFTALVTPFKAQAVDFDSLTRLVKQQLLHGVQGFVVNGTTAESPTLLDSERAEIYSRVRELVPVGFPIIMGTGSNSTLKTMQESKQAEKMGADALLVVVPYYNRPPQRGLLEHFKCIASHVSIPVILYNVPSRTAQGLEVETIKKLSEHPNIIGIKEATGRIDFARQIRAACGAEFALISGDDVSYDEFCTVGGCGSISVASHIVPQVMLKREISRHLSLLQALGCETNPIPVKMALFLMRLIDSPECRLPLVQLSETWTDRLRAEMQKEGLLP